MEQSKEQNLQTLASLLKEFLFLKFKFRGEALIQEIESEQWKNDIQHYSLRQILEALRLLETNTKIKHVEHVEAPRTKNIKDSLKPELVTVNLIVEKFLNAKGIMRERVKDNWFSLLKAAAVFPHECEPVDDDNFSMHSMFEYKHMHIQLAHASRLGSYLGYAYIRWLAVCCALKYKHPIYKSFEKRDPVLKSENSSYLSFEIYTGNLKGTLGAFDLSSDDKEDYIDIYSMTEEEKIKYLDKLYSIEQGEFLLEEDI